MPKPIKTNAAAVVIAGEMVVPEFDVREEPELLADCRRETLIALVTNHLVARGLTTIPGWTRQESQRVVDDLICGFLHQLTITPWPKPVH